MSAFARQDASAFRDALSRMEKFSQRAHESGPPETAYCLRVARRYLELRQYAAFGDWLARIVRTVDRNTGAIVPYLDDPQPEVVIAAARALAKSGDGAIVDRLGALLLAADGLEVRLALVQALAELGRVEGASWVRQRLAAARGDLPEQELVVLLGAIGRLGSPQDEGVLRGYLADIRPGVRRAMLGAIAEAGGSAALAFLEQEYRAGRLRGLDDVLIGGLGRARHADPVPFLLRIAEDAVPEAKRQVIEALGRRDPRGAGAFLMAELARERAAGRPVAPLVRAMVLLEDPEVAPQLLAVFSETDEFDSLALLSQYFERSGTRAAIPVALARLSRERDLDRMALFIDLLGALGAVDAVPQLETYLEHGAAGIRLVAAAALERLTGRSYPVRGMP